MNAEKNEKNTKIENLEKQISGFETKNGVLNGENEILMVNLAKKEEENAIFEK